MMTGMMGSKGRVLVAVVAAVVTAGLGSAAWADTAAEIDAGVKTARDACAKLVSGCEAAAVKAQGMLVFPEITAAGVGIGGSYGEGALIVGGATVGYYSATSGSLGLQLGAEKHTEIIMFMTPQSLAAFRGSSGWQAGADANVTLIDKGNSADIDTMVGTKPVIAFVFGQKGLMGDLSVEGAKVTKIQR
jgi:lipid-binding SYLF domain-containing protein